MTLLTGESSTEIEASIDDCWAVVEDISDAPRWQKGLEKVEVIERDAQGRAAICDTVIDGKFKKISCRVRMSYDAPHRLVFERIESEDLDRMRGSWELEEVGPNRTRATYRLELDPGKVGLMARPLEKALRPIVVGGRPGELARAVAQRG